MLIFLLLWACSGETKSPEPTPDTASIAPEPVPVPWSGGLTSTRDDIGPTRSWTPSRAIMHLHSPWSHDACDDEPLVNGLPKPDCLEDLRTALCDTRVDIAYLSDHPAHAAEQPFEKLFHAQADDERIERDGQLIATRIQCANGHSVLWRVGIEDDLMPLGLESHTAPGDEAESYRLYGQADPEAVAAHANAGGFVSMAHTEGKPFDELKALVEAGLNGVELFNLHAMFDPRKRSEDLDLDPLSWATAIAPFTRSEGTAEPDLLFIAVFQEQTVSIERWDRLQAVLPVVGFAGTDAHQNVLPMDLRDGERGDSYRRMLRWFSNHILIPSSDYPPSPETVDIALAEGRLYTAFEIFGTPRGLDFHLSGDDGTITEMGQTGQGSTLVVQCPTLSDASPKNGDHPVIEAKVYKDGQIWAEGCGEHLVTDSGVYRLRVDITPHHLRDFLGDSPDEWIHSYPWVYTNPIHAL